MEENSDIMIYWNYSLWIIITYSYSKGTYTHTHNGRDRESDRRYDYNEEPEFKRTTKKIPDN